MVRKQQQLSFFRCNISIPFAQTQPCVQVEFLTRSRWQWEGASPPKAVNLDTGDLLPGARDQSATSCSVQPAGVQILAEAPGLVVIAKESDVRTDTRLEKALLRQTFET